MTVQSDVMWTQSGGIIRGDEYGDFFGGAVSMSTDGNRIVVSGILGDTVLSNAGYAVIYEKCGNTWRQLGDTLRGDVVGELFGSSVAISGDGSTVAVGAPRHDANGTESGSVMVYRYTYNDVTATYSWTVWGNILSGDQPYDRFGSSVCLNYDGTRVAGGSPHANTGGNDAGHVRVYENERDLWVIMGGVNRGAGIGYKAGTSLAVNGLGDHVIIGSPYHTTTGGDVAGAAAVLRWADDKWTQKGITLEGRHADDVFGTSVAIDGLGETVAVGAPGVSASVRSVYTGDVAYRGYVDVYRYTMIDWEVYEWRLLGHLLGGVAEEEFFGYDVSLSITGNHVAVGAPELTVAGNSFTGGVTVFYREDNVWTQRGSGLLGEGAGLYSGSSLAISGDGNIVLVGSPGAFSDDSLAAGRVSTYQVVSPSSSSSWLHLDETLGITNLAVVCVLLLFSIYSFSLSKKEYQRSRVVYETSDAIEENNRRENVNMVY